MEQFGVDDERARAWVAELIVAWELCEAPQADVDAWNPQAPTIDLAWEPRDPGQEEAVYLLVRAAQLAGALTTPDGLSVEFEYVDDGDEGSYRWLVSIFSPARLDLVSETAPIGRLGQVGALAVPAALGILREAARMANLLVEQLSDYVAATAPPSRNG